MKDSKNLKNSQYFNLLAITLDKSVRPRAKELLHGKIIHLDFAEKQEIEKIPRNRLAESSAVCVLCEVKGHIRLAVYEMVKPVQ